MINILNFKKYLCSVVVSLLPASCSSPTVCPAFTESNYYQASRPENHSISYANQISQVRELHDDTLKECRRTTSHSDPMSVAYSWELLFRSLSGDDPVLAGELQDFISSIKRFSGVEIPEEWIQIVGQAEICGDSCVYFGDEPVDPVVGEILIHSSNKTSLPVGFSGVFGDGISEVNNRYIIRKISSHDTVALPMNWPPVSYQIALFGTNSVLTSRVGAGVCQLFYSGSGWHVVFISSSRSRIGVFGATQSQIYIELFDIKTLKPEWRFATSCIKSGMGYN